MIIATDVASRGLDIDHVEEIINYNTPGEVEDYVHRSGRTGRAGRSGKVLTFVSDDEVWSFLKIKKKLGDQIKGADRITEADRGPKPERGGRPPRHGGSNKGRPKSSGKGRRSSKSPSKRPSGPRR